MPNQPPNQPVTLVVLFGGKSPEHEVSCISASSIIAAADQEKYKVKPVGITRQGQWVQVDVERNPQVDVERTPQSANRYPQSVGTITAEGRTVNPIEILTEDTERTTVVMPVMHGSTGEDGTIQGFLEIADVPYIGSGVLSSALSLDKTMTKTVLQLAGIPHARWRQVTSEGVDNIVAGDDITLGDDVVAQTISAVEQLQLPVFIKPANAGSSIGISKVSDIAEITEALRLALRYNNFVIVEEAVQGREIEVAVLGNEHPVASVPGEIIPSASFYSYEEKYEDRATLCVPASLTSDETREVQALALATYRALRASGLARVDFFYEDGRNGNGNRGWLVNEMNTMPGFTPISMYPKLWEASGVGYRELIDKLVQLALDRHDSHDRHLHSDRHLPSA